MAKKTAEELAAEEAARKAAERDTDEGDAEDEEGDEEPPIDSLQEEVKKWRGLSRKHERRAKENVEAAKRLKELEDADKTEIERATERAAEAEKKAEAAERKALLYSVASRKGLTETQAKRLVGDTEEELEQDADELLASFKQEEDASSDTDKRGRPSRPRERLSPGSGPDKEPDETDPRKLAEGVPRL